MRARTEQGLNAARAAIESAPATIGVAAAATVATVLGALGLLGDPWRWPAATTWLMHGDARHLACDLAALLAVGLWLEPRAGPRRALAWMLLAGATSVGMHALAYPEQTRLFGLSAAVYTLVFAAVCGWALHRAWGIGLLLGLSAVLADEWVRGQSAALRATAAAGELLGAGAGWGGSFLGAPLVSTPRVHAACAVLGVVLGLAARAGRRCGVGASSCPAGPRR